MTDLNKRRLIVVLLFVAVGVWSSAKRLPACASARSCVASGRRRLKCNPISENDFECLASTGAKTPLMALKTTVRSFTGQSSVAMAVERVSFCR